MKENEKINELSDEQLSDVSGGVWGIDNLLPQNMGGTQSMFDNVKDWADLPFPDDPWVVIETGEGADGNGKYTYQIRYNKITGETQKERNYYWSDPNFAG